MFLMISEFEIILFGGIIVAGIIIASFFLGRKSKK